MEFEWDETKNRLNKVKHGVSFEVRIERYDEGHSDIEDRWMTIGMVYPVILVVIYTERQNGEYFRLISARQANEKEQRAYYQI